MFTKKNRMDALFFCLLLIVSCSTSKEDMKFRAMDTNIEKNFQEDQEQLKKFEVQETFATDDVVKHSEPSKSKKLLSADSVKKAKDFKTSKQSSKNKGSTKLSAKGKQGADKLSESKSNPNKSSRESIAESNSLVTSQNSREVLLDKLTQETQGQGFLAPKGYPKAFHVYDKKSKTVWSTYKPNVYIGETHTFEVSYLGITAGTIHIATAPVVKIANEPALHFKVHLKSADYYDYIYKLNDTLESYVRLRDFLPLKFKLVQRESAQEVDDLQMFDHKSRKTLFLYRRLKKGKEKRDKKEKFVPEYFQDSFSGLQFIRGLDLKQGAKFEFPIATRGKIWLLKLRIDKVGDEIEIQDKKVSAIRIKAETHFPGVLKKRGDIVFWFSNDEKKSLLKFQAKIKIGSVKGSLIQYHPGRKLAQ